MIICETERLILRKLVPEDGIALHKIYQDPGVLRYISGANVGTIEEEQARVHKHIRDYYTRHGHGLWATILKETGTLIGRCGILTWEIEGKTELEIAYLIGKAHWGRGYASEAAQAIRDYAFNHKSVDRVISLIHPENIASQKVAEKNGMTLIRSIELLGYKDLCFYEIQRNKWKHKKQETAL